VRLIRRFLRLPAPQASRLPPQHPRSVCFPDSFFSTCLIEQTLCLTSPPEASESQGWLYHISYTSQPTFPPSNIVPVRFRVFVSFPILPSFQGPVSLSSFFVHS
jgi:hypothetical protein